MKYVAGSYAFFLTKEMIYGKKKLSNGKIIHVIIDPLKRRIVYTTV